MSKLLLLKWVGQLYLYYLIDRLTLNDDDKKVRHWFVDQVTKYGCIVKVSRLVHMHYIPPLISRRLQSR